MSLEEHANRLDSYSHVSDVLTQDHYTSITAIDFKLYPLHRQTDSSNLVFGKWGSSFKGGLIRLPRISKDAVDETELESYLESFIPAYLVSSCEIRLEPELDLDDNYYYLHIETPETDLEGTFSLIERLQEYNPDKFPS